MTSLVLHLPMPPSVNNLYMNAGHRRVRTPKYRAWQTEAGWKLQSQRPAKIAGPVTVEIELFAGDKRRQDADNRNKAVLDLLVANGVIEADDNRIVKAVTSRWIDETRVHSCTVIIEPLGQKREAA